MKKLLTAMWDAYRTLPDTTQHAIAGVLISAFTTGIIMITAPRVELMVAALDGLMAAAIIGALKEWVWDKYRAEIEKWWNNLTGRRDFLGRGHVQWSDFIATVQGGALFSGVIVIVAILTGCAYDKLTDASCDPRDPYVRHVLDSLGGRTNITYNVPATSKAAKRCIEIGKEQGIPIDPDAIPMVLVYDPKLGKGSHWVPYKPE